MSEYCETCLKELNGNENIHGCIPCHLDSGLNELDFKNNLIVRMKQQIKTLQDRLKEAEEVIRFYGNNDNYKSKHGGHIENKNFHAKIGQDAGRLARQYLAEVGK